MKWDFVYERTWYTAKKWDGGGEGGELRLKQGGHL